MTQRPPVTPPTAAQHRPLPVLIVGAGPVGLTLAVLLRQQGVEFRLVEKNTGPSQETKAIAIHSRTLEIFRAMGVAEQAVARGFSIGRFSVQAEGKRLLDYDFSLLQSPYRTLLSLPQPETEALLLERLTALGGQVEWNTTLTELAQDKDHTRVTLVGPDGREEHTRARWVAACDGARSTLRKLLGMTFAGAFYERFFMLADADIQWSGSQNEGAFFLGAAQGYLAVAPIDERSRYRLFIEMPYQLPDDERDRPALTLENFQRLCEGRGQNMTLSNLSSTTLAAFQHRRVQKMRQGSVFLVGDSAHIGSPIGGQWMNLGIAEAYNLAWKLAFVEQGLSHPTLLDSYHEERYPVALEVENTAHRLTSLITTQQRALVWARNHLLPLLTRGKKIQRLLPTLISGHSYRYRPSAYIQSSLTGRQRNRWKRKGYPHRWHGRAPEAGELAPALPLWQAAADAPAPHLLDLFAQGHFTLLIFTATDQFSPRLPEYRALAASLEGDYPSLRAFCIVDALDSTDFAPQQRTLLDPDWRLHQRYHAAAGSLMLIRPDGYIAFQGLEPSALVGYLQLRSGLLKNVKPSPAAAMPPLSPLPA